MHRNANDLSSSGGSLSTSATGEEMERIAAMKQNPKVDWSKTKMKLRYLKYIYSAGARLRTQDLKCRTRQNLGDLGTFDVISAVSILLATYVELDEAVDMFIFIFVCSHISETEHLRGFVQVNMRKSVRS